jgi:hypothetical protein
VGPHADFSWRSAQLHRTSLLARRVSCLDVIPTDIAFDSELLG